MRSLRALTLLGLGLTFATPAHATKQCFYSSGKAGALTVTTSGSGCGTALSYGGLTGLWLGNSNTNESCTFTLSHEVDVSTLTVPMTAAMSSKNRCRKIIQARSTSRGLPRSRSCARRRRTKR